MPPLAVIAGPTASGKSQLAVALAHQIEATGRKAAIVNADSAQVYADLQILTARPTVEEMDGVEHRLFGTWDGASACSAADWADAAKKEIADLHTRGTVPILCGGTGLYIRTLLEGIAPVPNIDPGVRKRVRNLSPEYMLAELQISDPDSARRLGPHDTTRLSRALEVVLSTGKPLSDWQRHKVGGIEGAVTLYPCILLPPRELLYRRIDRRLEQMVTDGALQEVEALLARRLDPTLPVMRAIGVAEMRSIVLHGPTKTDEAVDAAKVATRQYAKRQYTWFRNQSPDWWPRVVEAPSRLSSVFAPLV